MPPKSPAKDLISKPQLGLGNFFSGVPPPPSPSPPKTTVNKKKSSGSRVEDNELYTLTVTKKESTPKKKSSKVVENTKSNTTSKHFPSASTSSSKPSTSTNKTTNTPSTSKPKPKVTDMEEIVILSDSDDDMIIPEPKSKVSEKKRKAAVAISSSDEEEVKEDKKVSPKGKGPARIAPKKVGDKSTTTASASKSKSKKKEIDDDESDDDDKKSNAKASSSSKKPPAKKVKKETDGDDGEAEVKPSYPKWSYAANKNKAGPSNLGAKEVPNGEANCLAGLTFVFTGEMSAFSREDMQDMAKRFGGRVTTAPSSKTSFVVLGSDPGPKKLDMIKKHGIKTLDEDGFLELIGQRPSGKNDPKFIEQQEKEAKKIKEEAKKMSLSKDAPEHKTQLWTVKYAPSKLTEICGNKGSVEKLSKWLNAWPASLKSDFKKPGPDAMGGFRCVLISGPPGIGKTTAAHLVAKLLGYNILELNASDVRSKKLLETAFQTTINNTTLSGFFKSTSDGDKADPSINQKSVIIMDEVDGMSSGDRGGVGALNALIRKTRVPIIAICNDKSAVKMKPLTSTCFQMIFKRPSAAEIRGRMMTVAFKEGIKMDGQSMDQLVAGSQSDIRQIVNMLSTWKLGAKTMDFDEGKKLAKLSAKNAIATPWTLYSKLFAPQTFSPVSGMTLNDKLDIYFQDHSLMPLFVQQNYLGNNFSKASGLSGGDLAMKRLELASKAADAISDGDLVDGMIHQGQQWSLMPVHGMFSCIRPAYFCHGSGTGYPAFSAWFGKNSTQGKLQRLLGEIQIRMRLRISGDRKEIRTSYIPTLWPRLVLPLQSPDAGPEAIDEVIAIMDEYFLSKEDWEAIIELGVGEGFSQEGVLKSIDSKIKAAFTRKYNTTDHPVPFARHMEGGRVAKKIAGGPAPDQEDVMLEDAEESEDEVAYNSADDNDVSKDKMVKEKKPKGAAKGKAKAAPKKK